MKLLKGADPNGSGCPVSFRKGLTLGPKAYKMMTNA